MAKPSQSRWKSRTKHDLIIEVWEMLDCESVGARELEQIQEALEQRFGEGAVESPAAIARKLADEGAVLCHPEVFECDLRWREQNQSKRSFQETLDFTDLSTAFASMLKLEEKRLQLQNNSEANSQHELRNIVILARRDSILRARSKIIDRQRREEAVEISQWLGVWLQAPALFADWLDLRRRSAEFREKFKQ